MDLKIACPACGQHIVVDSSAQGQTMNCPGCEREIVIPAIIGTQPPPPPSPQPTPVYVNVPPQKGRSIGWGVFWGLVGFFIILPILAIIFLAVFGIGIGSFMSARNRAQELAAARSNTNIVERQTQVEQKATNDNSPTVEKVEGAFGKKLGTIFNPAQARYVAKLVDGTPMYEFTPSTGFRSFNRYYVLITPTTQKIYCIAAMGHFDSREAAKSEQAVIMEILRQKYGETESEQPFELDDDKRIVKGRCHIVTSITGYGDVYLKIQYIDGVLALLAEKERLASEINKTGNKGL